MSHLAALQAAGSRGAARTWLMLSCSLNDVIFGSTPGGQETSSSTVLAAGAANPGKGGLSATIGEVDGGAGTRPGRAGSDGRCDGTLM